MSVSSISPRAALGMRSLAEMRQQLDELQRQLGTGRKSETYAGLGLDRGLLVGLRNRLSTLEGYENSITNVDVRISLAQTALGRVAEIGRTVKGAAYQTTDIESNGTTIAQAAAFFGLGEILGLLNTQVGERYIFSGRAADQPAVVSIEHIMDGDGARAGFKQIVAERKLADLGADGRGRVVISMPITSSVEVEEDLAGLPFGFKLSGINSSLTNSTAAGPTGVPPALSVAFTGLPNEGENIQFKFTLPDGSSETITLTATNDATSGPNEFVIGLTADDTAANLQAALIGAVEQLATTSLTAASAMAAADNFFNGTPQRVAGPPFDTATALVAGTAANTVAWYTGEDGLDPARHTAAARVDTASVVSYGMRANEEGLRWVIQNVAALAVMSYSPTDPDATARSAALGARVGTNLAVPAGLQKVEDISTELAGVQIAIRGARDRHRQTKSTLADMMEQIEGVSNEEVAAQILALQIRLQASLQTTALLYQTSLVNYL